MGYSYYTEVMNRQQQNQMENSGETTDASFSFFPELNSGVHFVGFGITDLQLEQKMIKGTQGCKLDNYDIRMDNIKL